MLGWVWKFVASCLPNFKDSLPCYMEISDLPSKLLLNRFWLWNLQILHIFFFFFYSFYQTRHLEIFCFSHTKLLSVTFLHIKKVEGVGRGPDVGIIFDNHGTSLVQYCVSYHVCEGPFNLTASPPIPFVINLFTKNEDGFQVPNPRKIFLIGSMSRS